MIHLWEYDSRRIDGVNTPQQMSDLERIRNEGWGLVLIKDDIDEEGRVPAIFKRVKLDTICINFTFYFLLPFV